MIRVVNGVVIGQGKGYVIIELGGAIGIKVFAPEPTLAQAREGDLVSLHTYLQVREDALTLFGFAEEDELAIFEQLLSVNGVGPKVALSTLSTLTPDALRLALANEEPAIIARVPGIGKRTAEKIVLELKDKVAPPTSGLESLSRITEVDSEVIEALVSLGYSVVEAQRAVQTIPSDAETVEERLRLALGQFSG